MAHISRINGITRGAKNYQLTPTERFEVCPVCKQRVKVGGGMDRMWVIQPHAPLVTTKVNELCAGVNTRIPVSP